MMRAAFMTRTAGLVLVVALVLAGALPASATGKKDASVKSHSPHRGSWLMVGLSPDGCSRGCKHVYSVIQRLSGNDNGVIVDFRRISYELVNELQPEFIVLSPQGTPWCRYTGTDGVALQNFLWILPIIAEDLNIPILGICGGHQALALAFGGKVGPIRGGEQDCMPYTRDRQGGVIPLTVIAPDPLFNGTQGYLKILESHYDEVKVLPPGFLLLASDRISPYQIMRHPTRPVYGIQGHPEHFRGTNLDGATLIKNFLHIAGAYNDAVRNFRWTEPMAPTMDQR
jgi:GMP synthase (glutamine-hydrolysing)